MNDCYYEHEHAECKVQGPVNTTWPRLDTAIRDSSMVQDYLRERRLNWDLAGENGWYPSKDAGDTYLRVVIPARTMNTQQVYWQARAIDPKAMIRYQSPSGPRNGALVYMCAYPSWKFTNEVVVVEGPMDALAAAECGFDSIALMGINPGKLALEHLVTLIAKRNTLILLDGEPEATKAAYEIAMHVSSTGIRAIVATLSGVKDLAKASFSYRKSFLEMYMEDFRS